MMFLRLFKNLVVVAALTLVYVIAGKLGLMLAFVHASATAVWPFMGIALAAFLLLGHRVWPAIWLGAFVVNITTAGSRGCPDTIWGGSTPSRGGGGGPGRPAAPWRSRIRRRPRVVLFSRPPALARTGRRCQCVRG